MFIPRAPTGADDRTRAKIIAPLHRYKILDNSLYTIYYFEFVTEFKKIDYLVGSEQFNKIS